MIIVGMVPVEWGWWITLCPLFGVFGAISGIFGAVQSKRAAAEAVRRMQIAIDAARKFSDETTKITDPFFALAEKSFGGVERLTGRAETTATEGRFTPLLDDIITQTQNLVNEPGLSPQDKIAFEDAQRLLNENLSQTGNLRSGAALLGGAELGRRVSADAMERFFGRKQAQLQLLAGLQGQGTTQELNRAQVLSNLAQILTGVGSASAQVGTSGRNIGGSLLQSAITGTAYQGQFELAKGQAAASSIVSGGLAVDSGINAFAGGFGGGTGGPAGSFSLDNLLASFSTPTTTASTK